MVIKRHLPNLKGGKKISKGLNRVELDEQLDLMTDMGFSEYSVICFDPRTKECSHILKMDPQEAVNIMMDVIVTLIAENGLEKVFNEQTKNKDWKAGG